MLDYWVNLTHSDHTTRTLGPFKGVRVEYNWLLNETGARIATQVKINGRYVWQIPDERGYFVMATFLATNSSTTENTYYKIRDKKTGKFSNGGVACMFNKIGKRWSSLKYVVTHLLGHARYTNIEDLELVEYFSRTSENFIQPLQVIIDNARERKTRKAADKASAKERGQLKKLQRKLDSLREAAFGRKGY